MDKVKALQQKSNLQHLQVWMIPLLFMAMTVLPLLGVTGRGRKPGKPQRTKHSVLAPLEKRSVAV